MMLQEHDGHVGAARSAPQFIAPSSRQPFTISDVTHCDRTGEGHCITCSDQALPARVLSIDAATGLALVEIENITEEIDISLVDEVSPGDRVLVHGGIAIANLEEANDE
jgi:hydrogenase assembly chaperone HypC/HupF